MEVSVNGPDKLFLRHKLADKSPTTLQVPEVVHHAELPHSEPGSLSRYVVHGDGSTRQDIQELDKLGDTGYTAECMGERDFFMVKVVHR